MFRVVKYQYRKICVAIFLMLRSHIDTEELPDRIQILHSKKTQIDALLSLVHLTI